MSLTWTVPPDVPSLFHSSVLLIPCVAAKNSVPFTSSRPDGEELAPAGLISLTMVTFRVAPSTFHSSRPCPPLAALKYSELLDFVSSAAAEKTLVEVRIVVPPPVPLLVQTERPVPSSAIKNSVPLKSVSSAGSEEALPD